ncbi:MAG: M48 family peptidase, partial [Stellaceae bacterium]
MPAPDSPTAKVEFNIRQLALGVPVAIRVSPRARRLSLRVDAGARGIELVLPPRFSAETAIGFVARHRGWIAARIAAMPPPLRLGDGAVVPVFGVPHRIRRITEPAAAPVTIAGGEILVRGDPAHLPRRVID